MLRRDVGCNRFILSSLVAYAEPWRFDGPLFRVLPHPVSGTPMIRLALASGLVVARLMRCSHMRDDLGDWVFPQAMMFISMLTIFFCI